MKRQFTMKMKVIDVMNEKQEEEMIQLIKQTIAKVRDPLSELYETKKEEIFECLKQIDSLLVSEELYKRREPVMTYKMISEKENYRIKLLAETSEKTNRMEKEIKERREQNTQMSIELGVEQQREEELKRILAEKDIILKEIPFYTIEEMTKKKNEGEKKRKDVEQVKKKMEENLSKLSSKKEEYQSLKLERDQLLKENEELERLTKNSQYELAELEAEKRKLYNEFQQERGEWDALLNTETRKKNRGEKEIDEMWKQLLEKKKQAGLPEFEEDPNAPQDSYQQGFTYCPPKVEPIEIYDVDYDDDLLF